MVTHKQIYRTGFWGSGLVNTTLCGRVHAGREMNVSAADEDVSCKFCQRLLERIAVKRLHEAIDFVEQTAPLPRCEHGSCLRDHGGELLEPDCGCRYAAN